MAKKGEYGEYICERCGSTNMTPIRYVDKGSVERVVLQCHGCGGEDTYDSPK